MALRLTAHRRALLAPHLGAIKEYRRPVALVATGAIVWMVLRAIGGGGKDPPAAESVCTNGYFVPIADASKSDWALGDLSRRASTDAGIRKMQNVYYHNLSLETTDLLYQDEKVGYCNCSDPYSKRIVATGKMCENDVTDASCRISMGGSPNAKAVPKKNAIPGRGGFLPVNSTTSSVCGCARDFGWSNDQIEDCDEPQLDCKATKSEPRVEKCSGLAGQHRNDWNQNQKCCCAGCATDNSDNCYFDGKCSCPGSARCVPIGQEDADLILPTSTYPKGVPVIKLWNTESTDTGCVCPENSELLSEYAQRNGPTYVTPRQMSLSNESLEKAQVLICANTFESAERRATGAECDGGIRWRTKDDNGVKIVKGFYDCYCNTNCNEEASGWTVTKDETYNNEWHCCSGHGCGKWDYLKSCLSDDEYNELNPDEKGAYCQESCQVGRPEPEARMCSYKKSTDDAKQDEPTPARCCPQCKGRFQDGMIWRCCNKDSPPAESLDTVGKHCHPI